MAGTARTAVELGDHAVGRSCRCAAIVGDGETLLALGRVDGVAGAIGNHDHDLIVAGVQIVIWPAEASRPEPFRIQCYFCEALDAVILHSDQARSIG